MCRKLNYDSTLLALFRFICVYRKVVQKDFNMHKEAHAMKSVALIKLQVQVFPVKRTPPHVFFCGWCEIF